MHNEGYHGKSPSLCSGCRTRLAQLPATPSLHLGRTIGKTSHASTSYPSSMCGPRARPGCDRVARRAHAPSPAGSSGTNTPMVPQYKREAASSPPVVCGAREQVLRTPSPVLAADAWQSHGRSCPGPEPRPPETAAWTHAGLDAGEHCHTWACGPNNTIAVPQEELRTDTAPAASCIVTQCHTSHTAAHTDTLQYIYSDPHCGTATLHDSTWRSWWATNDSGPDFAGGPCSHMQVLQYGVAMEYQGHV
jgi:hypothetical protein